MRLPDFEQKVADLNGADRESSQLEKIDYPSRSGVLE